jgi:thioredoxin reductase
MMTASTNPMPAADTITHISRMAKRLAKNVVIYTNGREQLVDELKAKIHSSKITVDNRAIDRFTLVGEGPSVEITFSDGTKKTEGFIASHPKVEQRAGALIEQLGLEMTPGGDIKANPPMNETSVKGVFAAGDAATPIKSVMQALYMGMFAGVGMTAQLQAESELKDEL